MTADNDSKRKEWLTNTLYALRTHFDKEEPVNPAARKDLRSLPSGKEGIVFRCADGRVDEMADLGFERGQYYELVSFGASVAPGSSENLALTAALRRATLKNSTSDEPTPPKAFIFIGHENCGANGTLLDSKLDPTAPSPRPEEAILMQPMASDALAGALKHARREDNRLVLHEEVSRSTILNSMKNIYECKAGETPVSELVDSGQAQVIGAMRGFVQQEDGKFPLSVYDPAKKDFVPVESLYDEAFPGNNHRTQEAITTRMDQQLHQDKLGFHLPPELSVQQGATTFIDSVNAGLAAQLERVNAMATREV